MGIQTKLLILIGCFLLGTSAGAYGVHKWYQAEQKAQIEKAIDKHNAIVEKKDAEYKKLAAKKDKVLVKTRIVKRKIFVTDLTACGHTVPAIKLRNEYAQEANQIATSRGDD